MANITFKKISHTHTNMSRMDLDFWQKRLIFFFFFGNVFPKTQSQWDSIAPNIRGRAIVTLASPTSSIRLCFGDSVTYVRRRLPGRGYLFIGRSYGAAQARETWSRRRCIVGGVTTMHIRIASNPERVNEPETRLITVRGSPPWTQRKGTE